MKKLLVLPALVACFALAAFADVRLPDTPKPTPAPKRRAVDSTLKIRFDPAAPEARLIIPKNQLRELRAALDEIDGGGGAETEAAGITRAQTVASGLFLSLAFVCGGVWLARGRRAGGKTGKLVAAGAVLGALGAAAPLVTNANVGPPSQLRTISSDLFDKEVFRGWNAASGRIKVEVAESGAAIELIVPQAEAEKK